MVHGVRATAEPAGLAHLDHPAGPAEVRREVHARPSRRRRGRRPAGWGRCSPRARHRRRRKRSRSAARAWVRRPVDRSATSIRTSSRRRPSASTGWSAISSGGHLDVEDAIGEGERAPSCHLQRVRRRPRRGTGPTGRGPAMSARRPGTLASGSGRSEMSSPGKASWCICVRMSPGSTRSTRRSGRSAPRMAASCSKPGLGGAVGTPALVGLHGRVGGDGHERGAGPEVGEEGLDHAELRDQVDLERRPEVAEPEAAERRQG